jgi:hypothetical protein
MQPAIQSRRHNKQMGQRFFCGLYFILLLISTAYGSTPASAPGETPIEILNRAAAHMAAMRAWQTESMVKDPSSQMVYNQTVTYLRLADGTYERREEIKPSKTGRPWHECVILDRDGWSWTILPDRKLALRFPLPIPPAEDVGAQQKNLQKQLADRNLLPKVDSMQALEIKVGSQPCIEVILDVSQLFRNLRAEKQLPASVEQKLPEKVAYVVTKGDYVILGMRIYNRSGEILKDTVVSSLHECDPSKDFFDFPAECAKRYPADLNEFEQLMYRPLPIQREAGLSK